MQNGKLSWNESDCISVRFYRQFFFANLSCDWPLLIGDFRRYFGRRIFCGTRFQCCGFFHSCLFRGFFFWLFCLLRRSG